MIANPMEATEAHFPPLAAFEDEKAHQEKKAASSHMKEQPKEQVICL